VSRLARTCVALFLAHGAAVVLMWWVALDPRALDGLAGRLNATGRITALLGTYLVLVQLVLRPTSMPPLRSRSTRTSSRRRRPVSRS